MRTSKTLLVSSLLLALSACGGKSVSEHLTHAESLIKAGDSNSAVIELKNAVKQAPSNADVRLLLADTYLALGQLELAGKEYERVIELRKSTSQVIVNYTKTLYFQGKYDDIIILELEDNNVSNALLAEFYTRQALAYLKLNEKSKATELIEQANAVMGDSPFSQLGRGYLEATTDLPAAYKIITEVISDHPDLHDALLLQGQFASALKDYENAALAFNRLLSQLPLVHTTRLYLADVYVKSGQLDDAEPHVNFILKLSTGQPFANQLKAIIEFERGNFEGAYRYIEVAIQNGLNGDVNKLLAGLSAFQLQRHEQANYYLSSVATKLPQSHPAQKALVITQLNLGYDAKATETLESFENLTEADVQFYTSASYQLIKAGNYDAAKKTVAATESIVGNDPSSLVQLGMLKISMNELDGVADLEKAMAIDPDLPQAKVAIAAAYIQTNSFDKALKLAQSWIAEEPENVDGYNLAALTHIKLNDLEKAAEFYQTALNKNPDNVSSLMFLAATAGDRKDFNAAAGYLNKVLNTRPSFVPALRLSFSVHRKLNQDNKALEQIETAFNEPQHKEKIRLIYAQALMVTGEYQAAAAILEANQNDNTYLTPNYWLTLIQSYVELGDNNKIKAIYDDWTSKQRGSETAWIRKIQFEESIGENNDALASSKMALVNLPNSLKLKLVQAHILSTLNQFDAADKQLSSLPDDMQNSAFGQTLRGKILSFRGDYQSALEYLVSGYKGGSQNGSTTFIYLTYKALNKKAAGLKFLESHIIENENDITSLMLLGNEYLFTDAEKAKGYFNQVISIDPRNANATNNVAFILYQQKRFNEALPLATKAVSIDSDNANLLDTLGIIQIALGNRKEAIINLRKASRIAPNNHEIKANLKRAEAM